MEVTKDVNVWMRYEANSPFAGFGFKCDVYMRCCSESFLISNIVLQCEMLLLTCVDVRVCVFQVFRRSVQ